MQFTPTFWSCLCISLHVPFPSSEQLLLGPSGLWLGGSDSTQLMVGISEGWSLVVPWPVAPFPPEPRCRRRRDFHTSGCIMTPSPDLAISSTRHIFLQPILLRPYLPDCTWSEGPLSQAGLAAEPFPALGPTWSWKSLEHPVHGLEQHF